MTLTNVVRKSWTSCKCGDLANAKEHRLFLQRLTSVFVNARQRFLHVDHQFEPFYILRVLKLSLKHDDANWTLTSCQ